MGGKASFHFGDPNATTMLNAVVSLGDVSHAIQLALAPVFLLTGIAGMLNVMAGRLARIIDRGRQLTERSSAAASSRFQHHRN